jgi:hypothetical protein
MQYHHFQMTERAQLQEQLIREFQLLQAEMMGSLTRRVSKNDAPARRMRRREWYPEASF